VQLKASDTGAHCGAMRQHIMLQNAAQMPGRPITSLPMHARNHHPCPTAASRDAALMLPDVMETTPVQKHHSQSLRR
jgi:hypothetical protein